MAKQLQRWLYLPAGWIFLLYAILAGASAWWLQVYPAVDWANQATLLIPLLVAGALLAWVITQILWLFSDRGVGIFHGIYLGLLSCVLLTVLIIAREAQYTHDLKVAEEIRAAREVLRRQSFEQAREALDAIASRREQMEQDRFLQYEGRVPEDILDQMRAIDQEILHGLRDAAEAFEAVVARSQPKGPESWLRFGSREELETERANHVALYEAGRVYLDYLLGLEARYERLLEAAELPPPADRYAVAEKTRLLQLWTHSGALRVRELDVEISAAAIRAIDLLLRHWEGWRFDRAVSRVVFDDGNVEMSFMRLLAEASELANEQAQLRRRLEELFQRQAVERAADGGQDDNGA